MKDSKNEGTMKLWGGRFLEEPAEVFSRFNRSFPFDHRLLAVDLQGSAAWSEALFAQDLLTDAELRAIQEGLEAIGRDFAGPERLTEAVLEDYEDVHSFVEAELTSRIGEPARKLHTGRSRNDQVATDLRLYLIGEVGKTLSALRAVQRALLTQAEKGALAPMPGYTHMQRAQPILWGHYLLSFFEMLERDCSRFEAAGAAAKGACPLGSGALAGSGFAVDREMIATRLGFSAPAENSLDAVSDRDFVCDYLYAASMTMVHLSRLAEDLILYASEEFRFVRMSDGFTSGSSLMPQKKNPDAMELVRGKSGRVVGNLVSLLTTLKGLPSSYNKDLQEDKEGLFDTIETLNGALAVTEGVLMSLEFDAKRAAEACKGGHLGATDLADLLVRKGIPFREAHRKVGELVVLALDREVELQDLPEEVFRSVAPELAPEAPTLGERLSPEAVVGSREVYGGTGPDRVRDALVKAEKSLEKSINET